MATANIQNAILDAIVTQLRTMNGPTGGYVSPTPVLVERVLGFDWSKKPRPYLAVWRKPETVTHEGQSGFSFYRSLGLFTVSFVLDIATNAPEGPSPVACERASLGMVEDIQRCIALNFQLSQTLRSGWIHPKSDTAGAAGDNLLLAAGNVEFEATWEWST